MFIRAAGTIEDVEDDPHDIPQHVAADEQADEGDYIGVEKEVFEIFEHE